MGEFWGRLALVPVMIVLGVFVLAIGSCTLALGIAASRAGSKQEPFLATFDEAFCEVISSAANPTSIGLQDRFERLVSARSDDTIRFTSLPAHWKNICLTSVESDIALPVGAMGEGVLFNLRSSICWGWMPHTITVFLIENVNDIYPVQLKVPQRIGPQEVLTDYTDVRVPAGYSLCAPREKAVARCVAPSPSATGCIYLFPAQAQ